MEDVPPEISSVCEWYREKLNHIASEIKLIVDQGRLIATEKSNLFLFKGMYKELKPFFDSFHETFDKAIELTHSKGAPTAFPNKGDKALQHQVRRHYYEACAIYEDHMNPTPTAPVARVSTAPNADGPTLAMSESRTVRARLPQINLPDFNGNPVEWPLFRDTYRPLIHDEPTLSSMEKFLFLVSCLKGSARSLISNVSLTEENYAQAWKILTEHYNDKRKLAHTYIKQVLDFKPLQGRVTANSLKTLISSVIESIESFRHLKITDPGDFILSYLILRCLDSTTKTEFEKKYADVEFPTYQNLVDFIKVEWRSRDMLGEQPEGSLKRVNRFQGSTAVQPNSPNAIRVNSRPRHSFLAGRTDPPRRSNVSQPPKGRRSRSKPTEDNLSLLQCPVCQEHHTLYQCDQFRQASANEKKEQLKNWNGCTNCLSRKHSLEKCTSLRRCATCGGRHHTWLHQSSPATPGRSMVSENKPSSSGVSLGSMCNADETLLGTALCEAQAKTGTFQEIRIVTDSGSQYSFMTEKCAHRLGLQVKPCEQHILGIGQVHLHNPVGKLRCTFKSKIMPSTHKELSTTVIVVPTITCDLPQAILPTTIQHSYRSYVLADPDFWKPGPVDVLLGGDLFFDIVTGSPVKIAEEIPRLLPTIFGYIVAGPIKNLESNQVGLSFLVQSRADMANIMNKFWEVEEISAICPPSSEDQFCEDHFQSTHRRLESGRYVVSLPKKDTISTLGNPLGQATKRLLNIETKLQKDLHLKEEYYKFMRDYLTLDHMRLAGPGTSLYTLPHHAVVKQQDGQMKLRTVFDASCRTSTGSLNDHLYTGPKLQLDIGDLLCNFRLHKIAFTADVVKMYRQILLEEADRRYQHILWRFDPSEAIQDYELMTVTYGLSSAPYLSQRTVLQLVADEGQSYPMAAKALREDIYVDDVVTGADSYEDATKLQHQLIELLSKGCFHLSKWASNSHALLQNVKEEECQSSTVSLSGDDEPKIKLLGMQWMPHRDIFTYEVQIPSSYPSKRAILSAIARIYDPLGFLSPVVFYAKLILQDMWIAQCDWDDLAPPELCLKWHNFLNELNLISHIQIPRCITHGTPEFLCLAGFCDASQRGYSAVIYLVAHCQGANYVHLIKAKTKLAPIKPMTVPRLELSGALLLSRLLESCESLRKKLAIQEIRMFTDSEIVLGWLSTPPHRLNTFVAHRTIKILELTENSSWAHVRSEDNPADCSSRGIPPGELQSHPLWWTGAHWLSQPVGEWPNRRVVMDDLPEMKKVTITSLISQENKSPLIQWMERFSSYQKMLNSLAYALRFIKKSQRCSASTGPITLIELREAKRICLMVAQDQHPIDKRHLRTLNPFCAEDGLLRVGGRLEHSTLPYDVKHPIILSGKSHFAKLLVDHYHVAHLHVGPTALQSLLQSRYWIVSARKLIKQRVFQCLKCYKATHNPQAPLMGNLPNFRIQEGQPFLHVGVDFAGPFYIRESLRRKAAVGKAYLCLFICMTTKAVHLEVVSACTTDAFLAALDRFVGRRGNPLHIYSDCGTNFVGAANHLKDIIQWHRSQQTQDDIIQHTASREIQWSFNPPASPHFGGLWEAGVKSAKTLLRRIVGETPLTFEELATLFCRIEGILNSRPLTPLSADPECLDCLTPGHFLIGRPLAAVPEECLLDTTISPLRRWNIVKQYSQHFWRRWKTEYLHNLQQRKKWTSARKNLQKGDLVILKGGDSPVQTWPLGRIIEVHPGHDDVTRVVTVKTKTGIYKRPVVKLVPLTPINEPQLDVED